MVNWYNYTACFFAGAFLADFVPHFVHGISGDRFPTPFAHPPGKGLSSSKRFRQERLQSGATQANSALYANLANALFVRIYAKSLIPRLGT
jgi:hypothetical protein